MWGGRSTCSSRAYPKLGATFGQMVIASPLLCAHVLGMLVQSFGANHVLWGNGLHRVGLAAMADRSFSPPGNARPVDEAFWLETADR